MLFKFEKAGLNKNFLYYGQVVALDYEITEGGINLTFAHDSAKIKLLSYRKCFSGNQKFYLSNANEADFKKNKTIFFIKCDINNKKGYETFCFEIYDGENIIIIPRSITFDEKKLIERFKID